MKAKLKTSEKLVTVTSPDYLQTRNWCWL